MKKYKVVLWMVESEEGLSKEQIIKMLNLLEDDNSGYMAIEIEGDSNSIAIGFICSSYYEELTYSNTRIKNIIKPVLDDWNNENNNNEYTMKDGTIIYMGCDYSTI